MARNRLVADFPAKSMFVHREGGSIVPPMNRFQTAREAKEYLIRRILEQADRDNVSLSDVERKMLYFSESGWIVPSMVAISREFDQAYAQDEYEKKIGQIIRRIHDRPDGNDDGNWDQAVQRLRDEDHYLLVLIDGTSDRPSKLTRLEMVVAIVGSVVVVATLLPISFFVHSHVDNPAIQKLIIGGALLALVVLLVFIATRGHRKLA